MTPFRTRIAKFDNVHAIHDQLVKFDAATTTFANAVKATDNADTLVETLFIVETDARQAIREQIESAYGRGCTIAKCRNAFPSPGADVATNFCPRYRFFRADFRFFAAVFVAAFAADFFALASTSSTSATYACLPSNAMAYSYTREIPAATSSSA